MVIVGAVLAIIIEMAGLAVYAVVTGHDVPDHNWILSMTGWVAGLAFSTCLRRPF